MLLYRENFNFHSIFFWCPVHLIFLQCRRQKRMYGQTHGLEVRTRSYCTYIDLCFSYLLCIILQRLPPLFSLSSKKFVFHQAIHFINYMSQSFLAASDGVSGQLLLNSCTLYSLFPDTIRETPADLYAALTYGHWFIKCHNYPSKNLEVLI